ncbi:MAG: IS200/IS605 family element transposase accessory protein TnpB [Candidatus Lokiarchaeota archaeon]|nr:IS200/IS605 family element transposase accessory protein TnpB [Candidatus Lokiarchaeota archaeon]MBD3343263.1 IS200/IS605 family element transposase accessory protein TnpB [Candidatus Lokiarchaeota archaeon]
MYCLDYHVQQKLRVIEFLEKLLRGLRSKRSEDVRLALLQTWNNAYFRKAYYVRTKRARRVRDHINKIARNLINYCIAHEVGVVIFGYNKGWKKSNLARKFNQYWGLHPVAELLNRLKYLCKKYGITLWTTSEHYTSVASAYLEEPLQKGAERQSVRGPAMRGKNGNPYSARGLIEFRIDGEKKYMHSDANAAFNMIRKYLPHAKSYNAAVVKNERERLKMGRAPRNVGNSLRPEIDYFSPLRNNKNWLLQTPKTIWLDGQTRKCVGVRATSRRHL